MARGHEAGGGVGRDYTDRDAITKFAGGNLESDLAVVIV